MPPRFRALQEGPADIVDQAAAVLEENFHRVSSLDADDLDEFSGSAAKSPQRIGDVVDLQAPEEGLTDVSNAACVVPCPHKHTSAQGLEDISKSAFKTVTAADGQQLAAKHILSAESGGQSPDKAGRRTHGKHQQASSSGTVSFPGRCCGSSWCCENGASIRSAATCCCRGSSSK